MTRDEWQRIKTIAAGALEQPDDAARSTYLESSCGQDTELRNQVESLLRSTAAASPLFETPSVLIAGAAAVIEALAGIETSRIGESIGPYRLVRELGGGGMGAAYLAVRADHEYEKAVAIKIIKRGMDTDAVLRRFRHERQILADLDHTNIARLLDGGTTSDGVPYFVMEYVEGVPIDRYCDAHHLSTSERIKIFQLVCDAVRHAHAHRVIHRDLKPGNILVTADGVPKLLDFGISKVLTAEATEASESTAFSRAMTPQYASPEQVRGAPVTAASDVYSLGLLLFELLTGKRPYSLDGRTLQEIDQIVCREEPERPRSYRRELAGDLDNIVLMALRKEPERRYSSVDALSEDLQRHLESRPVRARGDDVAYRTSRFLKRHRARVIEGVIVLVLMAMVLGAWWLSRGRGAVAGAVGSVAVLPFSTQGGNADIEYLSDGLAEGLIDGLSRVPSLRVQSRNTVIGYKGRVVDPRVVGRDLNVQAVVLGSLTQSGDEVRVVLEGADGRDGHRLWQDRYTERLANLAQLRDRIMRDVSQRLGVVEAARAPVSVRQSSDSEAYQLYLRGRYVWNKRTEDGFRRGLDYFREALGKDPRYALAYTGIADCYNLLGIWGAMAPNEAMPKVKEAALNAITIDNTLAEAHTSLAFVHWVYDWDWAAAAREFETAIQLNPGYATAHDWYAYYLASQGQFEQAIAHVKQAQTLEPVSLSIGTDLGEIYYWSRQYDRAIAQLRSVLQVEPDYPMARNILGLTYLKTGNVTGAVEELEAARRLSSGPRTMSTLAYGYGAAGSKAKARQALDELIELSKQRYTSAFALAIAQAGVGDRKQAFVELEQAYAERSDTMAVLRVYPVLDELRDDARFKDLVQRIGTIP